MYSQEKCREFLIKFAYWASLGLIALAFIYFLFKPLLPFIVAFVVAAALQPVLKWCEKHWKFNHGVLATALTVLSYVLIVGLVLLLLIGIFSAIINWASGLPDTFTDTVRPWIEKSSTDLLDFVFKIDPQMGQFVQNMLPDALSALGSAIMNFSVGLVSWASSVGSKLPGAMLAAIICVIATAFLSTDYEMVVSAVIGIFPPRGQRMIEQMRAAVVRIIMDFARSYMLILFITFLEVFVGLSLIGFENSAIIATLIAIFDFMPILGSGMILLPWTVVTFIQGSIKRGIGLMVLWLVVVIARQIMEPRIVGKRVGLYPLVTLLCMWLGLKLFGGVGMLALPVIVLILKDLYENGLLSSMFIQCDEKNAEDSEGTAVPEKLEEEK